MIGIIFEGLAVLASILFLSWAFPRSPFGRLVRTTMARLGLAARGYEERNATALYDATLEQQQAAIAGGADGVARYKANLLAFRRQHQHAVDSLARLDAKLDALEAGGAADSDAEMLHVAGQVAIWQKRRDAYAAKIAACEATLKRGVSGLRIAQQTLASQKEERDFMVGDLEMEKANEEVAGVLSGVDGALGGAGSAVAEARERLARQIDTHRARAEVSSAIAGTDDVISDAEADRSAGAAAVLAARRAAKAG